MITLLTLNFTAKLTFEQICYYRVVPGGEVLTPLLTLLIYRKFIAFNFFIFGFLFNSVQLIVHAVEEESQELLRILLAIAAELASYATYLLFQLTRRDRAASAHSCILEKALVGVCEPPGPYWLLACIVGHEILS